MVVVQRACLNSYNPSSNPAEADSFSVKFVFEKNEKEVGIGPL